MTWDEIVVAVCLGVGLAAACGFRVFVPPLVAGIALRLGAPLPGEWLDWLGSWPALAALGAASTLELVAYYVPWLDHALDTIASPVAIIAGILIAAGATSELHPVAQWSIAIVAGGGAAAITQTATVLTRALSAALTAGFANFLVSTGELLASVALAIVAIVIAPLALLFLVFVLVWLVRLVLRRPRPPVREQPS